MDGQRRRRQGEDAPLKAERVSIIWASLVLVESEAELRSSEARRVGGSRRGSGRSRRAESTSAHHVGKELVSRRPTHGERLHADIREHEGFRR